MTHVYDIINVGAAPFLALGKKIWENCSFENVNKKMDTGNFLGEFVRLLLKTEQHTNLLQEDK